MKLPRILLHSYYFVHHIVKNIYVYIYIKLESHKTLGSIPRLKVEERKGKRRQNL